MNSAVRLAACALLALLAAPAVTAGGGAGHSHPQPAGEAFQKIEPPQPAGADGKIEVIELFWYGCPHCYSFEPYLDQWLKTKPSDVEFVRMPGVLNPSWVQHARAYYTAQKLGVLDQIHMPLFHAIHRDRQRIFSEDELREFFTEHGVDDDDFDRVFRSSEVDTRMKQALFTAKNARVTGVPTILVNGRYLTSGTMSGSFEKMLETTDRLVAMERQRLDMASPPAAPAETAAPQAQAAPATETVAAPQATPPGGTPAPAVETPPVATSDVAPAPAPAAGPSAPAAPAPEGKSPARILIILGLLTLAIIVVLALRGRRNRSS